jgi:hypothetical protein
MNFNLFYLKIIVVLMSFIKNSAQLISNLYLRIN